MRMIADTPATGPFRYGADGGSMALICGLGGFREVHSFRTSGICDDVGLYGGRADSDGTAGSVAVELFVSNADGSGEQKLTEGYLDYNPVWSPDGQWIVFTSERNGSADLYRMRPDGSGLERLTDDPAYDDQAAFSPDGNRISFVTTRAGGRGNLWILDLNTRQGTPLPW